MKIVQIGKVSNSIQHSMDPAKFRDVESRIVIDGDYADGLYRIEESDFITVVFSFHESGESYHLRHTTRHGEYKGVFASRSPHRPSSLGISTVRLLDKTDNVLRVRGLDAINGTPVIDIKPFAEIFDGPSGDDNADSSREGLQDFSVPAPIKPGAPRYEIKNLILADDKRNLLLRAGQLHGHYCPGIALGVHLSMAALKEIRKFTDGIMENLLAVVEMNNCAVDGVQFITGCSLGNNALIFEDVGKNALTLAIRGGQAVRATVKKDWREGNVDPKYTQLFQKVVRDRAGSDQEIMEFRKLSQETSFAMMNIPSHKIVNVEQVNYEPPERAPIHPSFECASCGEVTMGSRKVVEDGKDLCLKCGGAAFYRLTGHGIESHKD